MSCVLFVDDDDKVNRVNIDELYEKHQRRDLKQLSIFNKILNRIHKRITTTNRMRRNDKHIWFHVPEYIFGEPLYDQGDCIAYIVTKLQENGFFIKYMHPNTLFVSWENWVPTYKRNEIKKKIGVVLNEKGEVVERLDQGEETPEDINAGLFNNPRNINLAPTKPQKQYTPIDQYKPTGNLVYNKDILDKIEKKVSFQNP
jgi:hypothetical protein